LHGAAHVAVLTKTANGLIHEAQRLVELLELERGTRPPDEEAWPAAARFSRQAVDPLGEGAGLALLHESRPDLLEALRGLIPFLELKQELHGLVQHPEASEGVGGIA